MIIWTIFLLMILIQSQSYKLGSNYLTNYQIIHFVPKPTTKSNLAYLENFDSLLIVNLNILNTRLKIVVRPATAIPVRIYEGNQIISTVGSHYHGRVSGNNHSEAIGYFYGLTFIGFISLNNIVYHLEPLNKSSVIFYSEFDLNKSISFSTKSIDSPIKYDNLNVQRDEYDYSDELVDYKGKACEVELVADHKFYEHHSGIFANIIAEMIIRTRKASNFLASVDWDGDNFPDGLSLIIKNIIIFKDSVSHDYHLANEHSSVEELLDNFGLHVQHHCLGICFTYRLFSHRVLGLSWVANKDSHKIGGLCSEPAVIAGFGEKQMIKSYNTLIVTDLSANGKVPRALSVAVLIHEIGHALGSPHDEKSCMYANNDLQLLMAPTLPFPLKEKIKFSHCSIEHIREVLEHKGKCLIKIPQPQCGNYIVERGEQCDCGDLNYCHFIDPCCTPPGLLGECRIRRNLLCTPDEGPCCDQNCLYVPAEVSKSCINVCFNDSQCDGKSAQCPKTSPLPIGTACSLCNWKYCYCDGSGHCITSTYFRVMMDELSTIKNKSTFKIILGISISISLILLFLSYKNLKEAKKRSKQMKKKLKRYSLQNREN